MKIDLHNHTTLSSTCSILDVHDLISLARERGLDGVCVTEHNTMEGGFIAEKIGREEGFLVLPAQEVKTQQGDILAYGLFEEGLRGIALSELCELAIERDALLVAAHPFRINAHAIGRAIYDYADCFAAVETLNGNCSDAENGLAQRSAEELQLGMTGGSDAHSTNMVARYYTEFEDTISDIPSLLKALRGGRFHAMKNTLFKKTASIKG